MLNVDTEQYIRCVNCWMLHKNNKSILEHWNNGDCLFYCTVCGKSFHDSIKDLQPHIEQEHGIQQSSVNACRFSASIGAPTPALTAAPAVSVQPSKPPQIVKLQLKKELLKELIKMPETSKKASTAGIPSKLIAKKSTKTNLLDDNCYCGPCDRKFATRRALSTHHTLIHKKKGLDARAVRPSVSSICTKTINPIAVLGEKLKSKSKNQNKSTNKKWKLISTNEAVMKTVIRKVPSVSMQKQQQKKIPVKQPIVPKSIHAKTNCESTPLVQQNDTAIENISAQNIEETEISQDQTVSSTYLSARVVAQLDNDEHDDVDNDDIGNLDIKPEPMEEYSNNYVDLPIQSYNGWVHLPPQQYDEWNYGDGNAIDNGNILDSYLDTSPRLKVKDLNDLQHPRQLSQQQPQPQHQYQQQQQQQRYPVESQGYVPPNSMYKDQPVIMPNQNMSGFQIQNVQSYQVPQSQPQQPPPQPPQPPVLQPPPPPPQPQLTMLQPPPLQPIPVQQHHHHQQQQQHQHQQQSYTNYSCVNTMNLPSPSQEICQPTNLYEMHHMSQAQPIQSTQLINPIYMIPTPPTSTHTVSDYHY